MIVTNIVTTWTNGVVVNNYLWLNSYNPIIYEVLCFPSRDPLFFFPHYFYFFYVFLLTLLYISSIVTVISWERCSPLPHKFLPWYKLHQYPNSCYFLGREKKRSVLIFKSFMLPLDL